MTHTTRPRSQFPGDFRPLLKTNLKDLRGDTPEERHTSDWLLAKVTEQFLWKLRKLPAD